MRHDFRPEPGMGITIRVGSDRYPGTITHVSASGSRFTFRQDTCHRTDHRGQSEEQNYLFVPTSEGEEETAYRSRVNDDGPVWRVLTKGFYIRAGRSAYQDPSF